LTSLPPHSTRSATASAPSWLSLLPAFRPKSEAPPALALYLSSLVLVLAALALRWWTDPWLPPGFPFLTFFPSVVISAFVLGLGPGILAALLSFVASWYFFIEPRLSLGMSSGTLVALGFYALVIITDLVIIYLVVGAYSREAALRAERDRLVAFQGVLMGELDHRIKNIFASVNAVVGLSRRHAATPEELATKLRQRIDAMGRANGIIHGSKQAGPALLADVATSALQPFLAGDDGRVSLSGPPVALDAAAVTALSLILHELGTNAAKYGALSAPEGKLAITWHRHEPDAAGHDLEIRWLERGGPSVEGPAERSGFGTELVQRMSAMLGGGAITLWQPEGVEVVLKAKTDAILPQA